MPPQFDIPAPWAGPAIAALIIAICFLATVDWIHPVDRTPERTTRP